MRHCAMYCGGIWEEEQEEKEFAKSYTSFAETANFPPITSERTNCMTGKFIIHREHSQISIKLFCHSYGHEWG